MIETTAGNRKTPKVEMVSRSNPDFRSQETGFGSFGYVRIGRERTYSISLLETTFFLVFLHQAVSFEEITLADRSLSHDTLLVPTAKVGPVNLRFNKPRGGCNRRRVTADQCAQISRRSVA